MNSQHLLYNKLAWLYDKIYPKIFSYHVIFNIIDLQLINNGSRKVLEVACGTGRLMSILEEKWYEVTGLDLSSHMLSIARKRCQGKLIQEDMRRMNLNEKFDAVLCFGNSFTYIQNDKDIDNTLIKFRQHLEPGGILIFDNIDASKINKRKFETWLETKFSFEDMIITRRTFNSNYNSVNNTWDVLWNYIIEKDEESEGLTDKTKIRAFHKNYLFSKLKKHGFISPEVINEDGFIIKTYKRKY
ncbi:class I SAM-dependent methyltransferase [Candidatus Bathyarchaeota archaeon]|nr:class I SAM-dependent methyltransferase [Candidatus Bathyarchaeota archaeon]